MTSRNTADNIFIGPAQTASAYKKGDAGMVDRAADAAKADAARAVDLSAQPQVGLLFVAAAVENDDRGVGIALADIGNKKREFLERLAFVRNRNRNE